MYIGVAYLIQSPSSGYTKNYARFLIQTRNVNNSRICRRSLHDICGTHSLDTRRRSLISYNIGCQYFINFTSRHYFVPRTQMWRMRITLFDVRGRKVELSLVHVSLPSQILATGTTV